MSKYGKIIIVISSICLTGCCLYLGLLFDIGHMGSGWIDFLAKSPPDTWTISGFTQIRDLSSSDDLLFFQAYKKDGSIDCPCIYAADKITGKIVWSTESLAIPLIQKFRQNYPDASLFSGMINLIAISNPDHRLYLKIIDTFYVINSLDGSVIWESELGDFAYYSIPITDNEVFLVDEKQNLVAHDKASGRTLWERPTNNEKPGIVRLSLQNSTIYEKFEMGEQDFILALNRADGTKKWQVPIRAANYVPVFFEDTLIFCQFDQWGKPAILTALQSESGNLVWEREFTGTYDYPDLKIIDGQLFFRLVDKDRHTDDILYSVDPKTGALLWTFNNDLRYGKIRYTIQGEHIFIVTSNKLLFSLDRRTGQVAWTSNLEAAPIYLLENQSILLVASEGGQISAFDENTGAKLWGYASNISRSLFIDEEDAGFLFQINSGKLLIADDTAWIQTLDIKTGKQTSGWNHNGRYQWLFKANYGLGPSDGQFLFITGDDGRFSGAGTGFERIFKINLDKLIQP